jgi:hypothetical protein
VCMSGGGGGSNAMQQQLQVNLATAQMAQQQQLTDQQLGEQRREFDVQQEQAATSLANERELQAVQQGQVADQAALTREWQLGRSKNQKEATDAINAAFANFNPDYYNKFTQDYTAHYQPEIERQFGTAQNNLTFGLARTGNLASQTAADQYRDLTTEKGLAQADLANRAIGAQTDLQNRVTSSRQQLMSQALSDATLGSPITPGSADAITAQYNNTSSALAQIRNTAGDVVTTLSAVPQYSSLGSLFGNLAQSATSAFQGAQNYAINNAFQNALASNPTRSGSGRTY